MKLVLHIIIYSILALTRCLLGMVCSVIVSLSIAVVSLHLLRMLVHLLKSFSVDIDFAYKYLNGFGGTNGLVLWCTILVWLIFVYRCIRPVVNWHNLLPKCKLAPDRPDRHYIDDLPLRGSDEDILGRKAFEDRVLHLIDNASSEAGAHFIGLWGRWGIGKTSCMNRIEDRSKERGLWRCPIYVHFDLLQYSGRDDLLAALFDVIADSAWMKFYGVSGVSSALGGRMVTNGLLKAPAIRHWCYDVLCFILYFFCSQEHIQACLARSLRNIKRQVVVVVDDLERLPKDEVCAVMRMLKSVGNLPYVTYVILASEPHLALAMGSMVLSTSGNNVDAGREYLRKIVPDSVELPDINNKGLIGRYLSNEIERFARLYWYKFDVSETSFFFVQKMIDTVRGAKQLVNAVHSALEEQKVKNNGSGVSVNLEDLVILQAVRLKWPDFYDAMPEMYAFFRNKGSVVCTDEMIKDKYLKFVPKQDWEAARLFMLEYLKIKRQQKFIGLPKGEMQWHWEIENVEDYKLYEEYRLASVYCFENYFATQFPRRMVSKIQFITACECVESYDVAKLVATMLDVDSNRSLPELLFLIGMKYGDGDIDMVWTILRALARISDRKLLSSSARYGLAANAASVYKDIVWHARAGLIRIEKTEHSALSRLITVEKDSFVLFAELISGDYDDYFEKYANGEVKEPFRLGTVEDLKALAAIVRDRIGEKMSKGLFADTSWSFAALKQINQVVCDFGIKEGGLTAYRPEGFAFIPSIEIIVLGDRREESLERTLASIILSIDAYSGAVKCRIRVVTKTIVEKRAAFVERIQARWPGLDIIMDDKIFIADCMWVAFVRSGDMVAKEWFSVLAYESFYTSLDIVSFNYYTFYFEVILGNRLGAIENTTDISLYIQPLIGLNRVASGFWNKMYKATLFTGRPRIPEDEGLDNTVVTELLLRCKKIAHVDKYLLGHHIDMCDMNKISGSAIDGWNYDSMCAIWNMKALKGTIYGANAFSAMVESLRNPPRWEVLYRPILHRRLIDDICPKTWVSRRLRMWLCSKMPWMSMLLFPLRQDVGMKDAA